VQEGRKVIRLQTDKDISLNADNIKKFVPLFFFTIYKVAFMRNKRKLMSRRRDERRKTPDRRRNGFDRRTNGDQEAGDNGVFLNTQEACLYLKISRPTYLKYINTGKIRAQKIGRGWRVFKEELDRFVRGE
jgi:excisionase family DNA binding protein